MGKYTALIDADILVYTAASSAEHSTDWGNGLWTLHATEEEAISIVQNLLGQYLAGLERVVGHPPNAVVFAFTDRTDNWRTRILPTYKSNRKDKRPPMLLEFLREYIRSHHEVWERPGLEADDVLGILATSTKLFPGRKIIVSIDKDFGTIPTEVYNPTKDVLSKNTLATADYFHLVQALSGDTTDGYSGCPGIGNVRAGRALSEALEANEPLWPGVVALYAKAGLGEEEALVQARVARICRASDYDFVRRRVIPWSPCK